MPVWQMAIRRVVGFIRRVFSSSTLGKMVPGLGRVQSGWSWVRPKQGEPAEGDAADRRARRRGQLEQIKIALLSIQSDLEALAGQVESLAQFQDVVETVQGLLHGDLAPDLPAGASLRLRKLVVRHHDPRTSVKPPQEVYAAAVKAVDGALGDVVRAIAFAELEKVDIRSKIEKRSDDVLKWLWKQLDRFVGAGPLVQIPTLGALPSAGWGIFYLVSSLLGSPLEPSIINVGTVPADTRIVGVTPGASALFEFVAEGVASSECALENGDWERCESPIRYSVREPGVHTFQVRGLDPAGEVIAGPVSYTYTVGDDLPTTPITEISIRRDSATFWFDGGISSECRLDDEEWELCHSPVKYDRPGVGEHLFEVRAVAGQDGVEAEAASHRWIVADADAR